MQQVTIRVQGRRIRYKYDPKRTHTHNVGPVAHFSDGSWINTVTGDSSYPGEFTLESVMSNEARPTLESPSTGYTDPGSSGSPTPYEPPSPPSPSSDSGSSYSGGGGGGD